MPHKLTYDDLVELARLCIVNSLATAHPATAAELRKMAKQYQERAAELNGGKVPEMDDGAT